MLHSLLLSLCSNRQSSKGWRSQMFYVSRMAGRGEQDAALPPPLPLLQQPVQHGGAHKWSMCLGWQEGESRMLHSLLLSLCSNKQSSKVALTNALCV